MDISERLRGVFGVTREFADHSQGLGGSEREVGMQEHETLLAFITFIRFRKINPALH